jgi:hypothetical protein
MDMKKIPPLCLRNGISEFISCKLPGYGYHEKCKFIAYYPKVNQNARILST